MLKLKPPDCVIQIQHFNTWRYHNHVNFNFRGDKHTLFPFDTLSIVFTIFQPNIKFLPFPDKVMKRIKTRTVKMTNEKIDSICWLSLLQLLAKISEA